MIHLTRMNKVPLVLNCDLIEFIEATPDTVVSLTNGQKLRVLESPDEIVKRVLQFRCDVLEHRLPKQSTPLYRPNTDAKSDIKSNKDASFSQSVEDDE